MPIAVPVSYTHLDVYKRQTMLLKTRLRCQCLLKTRHSLHTYSLFKYHAGRRLVQRFPSSVDILFEKDHLYQAVIDLAPQPDVQWLAIEKSVAMVENSGLESQDPAAWMDLALSVQRKVLSLIHISVLSVGFRLCSGHSSSIESGCAPRFCAAST